MSEYVPEIRRFLQGAKRHFRQNACHSHREVRLVPAYQTRVTSAPMATTRRIEATFTEARNACRARQVRLL